MPGFTDWEDSLGGAYDATAELPKAQAAGVIAGWELRSSPVLGVPVFRIFQEVGPDLFLYGDEEVAGYLASRKRAEQGDEHDHSPSDPLGWLE